MRDQIFPAPFCTATMPVRATSKMEKGRIMDWKVSRRSGVSDNSRVRDVGEMSATLAPMI